MRSVNWLIEGRVIPPRSGDRWDGLRDLRNETVHIGIRRLTTPHEAPRVLELLAVEVDARFASEPRLETNAAL